MTDFTVAQWVEALKKIPKADAKTLQTLYGIMKAAVDTGDVGEVARMTSRMAGIFRNRFTRAMDIAAMDDDGDLNPTLDLAIQAWITETAQNQGDPNAQPSSSSGAGIESDHAFFANMQRGPKRKRKEVKWQSFRGEDPKHKGYYVPSNFSVYAAEIAPRSGIVSKAQWKKLLRTHTNATSITASGYSMLAGWVDHDLDEVFRRVNALLRQTPGTRVFGHFEHVTMAGAKGWTAPKLTSDVQQIYHSRGVRAAERMSIIKRDHPDQEVNLRAYANVPTAVRWFMKNKVKVLFGASKVKASQNWVDQGIATRAVEQWGRAWQSFAVVNMVVACDAGAQRDVEENLQRIAVNFSDCDRPEAALWFAALVQTGAGKTAALIPGTKFARVCQNAHRAAIKPEPPQTLIRQAMKITELINAGGALKGLPKREKGWNNQTFTKADIGNARLRAFFAPTA